MSQNKSAIKDISDKYWNVAESIFGYSEDIDSYRFLYQNNNHEDKEDFESVELKPEAEKAMLDMKLLNVYAETSKKTSVLPYEAFIQIHELILAEDYDNAIAVANLAIKKHGRIRELIDLKKILERKSSLQQEDKCKCSFPTFSQFNQEASNNSKITTETDRESSSCVSNSDEPYTSSLYGSTSENDDKDDEEEEDDDEEDEEEDDEEEEEDEDDDDGEEEESEEESDDENDAETTVNQNQLNNAIIKLDKKELEEIKEKNSEEINIDDDDDDDDESDDDDDDDESDDEDDTDVDESFNDDDINVTSNESVSKENTFDEEFHKTESINQASISYKVGTESVSNNNNNNTYLDTTTSFASEQNVDDDDDKTET